jgi:hypothetical protein
MVKRLTKSIRSLTDAAIVNSSLGKLRAGCRVTCTSDLNSLQTFTYLLLIGRVHVLPAIGPYTTPVGSYREVVREFPELEGFACPGKRSIELQALTFHQQHQKQLLQAWNKATQISDFFEWGRYHKTIAMPDHSIRHGGLFSRSTIPLAMMVTGLSRRELFSLYQASKRIVIVKTWSKRPLENEVWVVTICWMLDGLIRVIYYNLLARAVGCEYIPHDFRSTLSQPRSRRINHSTQYLANLIVEHSLAKRRVAERLQAYFLLVKQARREIASNAIAGIEAEGADAVRHALKAAASLKLQLTSDGYERALENMRIRDLTELERNDDQGTLTPLSINHSKRLLKVVNPAASRFAEFKQRLEACPTGREHFEEYENLCTEVWTYLFADKLGLPKIQKPTSDRVQRRDSLFPNLRKSPFFERVFSRFNADFIILDFKNYRDRVGSDVVEDVSHYANQALGNFVIAVSRKGGGSAATAGQIRLFKERKIAVLALSDQQMLEMIARKERGGEPEDILSDLLDELLIGC